MLSDIIMPEMNGYQLATIVQEKYPSIKIQLASGFSDNRHIDMIDENLYKNLLNKPYDLQVLLKNIRALLDNKTDPTSKIPHEKLTTEKKIISPLEWTDTLSVDVPEIDRDHQTLLSLLNRCIEIANGTMKNKELDLIFDELLAYTQYHFQREERIMEACDYPQLQEHRKVHQLLIKDVQQYKREYDQGNLTADSLLDFLSSWLTEHIAGMDKEAASHYKGKKDLIQQALKE